MRIQCVLIVSLLGIASCVVAGTYHVAKTGSDVNPGTQSQPFLTIQKGLDVAQAGDVVRVGGGVYEETVSPQRNGTMGSYITLDGTGETTVQRVIIDESHFMLKNITIEGYTNKFGSMLWFRRGGHHAIVSNVVVNAASAIDVDGISWEPPSTTPFGSDAASNCTVVDCRVTGMLGSTAISICGDNNLIAENYVHDVGQADFVRLWGRNNVIRGNTFTNNFIVEGIGNHIDFIQTFGNNRHGSWGHVLDGNVIIGIEGGQLAQLEGNVVPEIGNWTFQNNLFVDIDLQASCTIPYMKFYNNVFYRCNNVNRSHALNFGSRAYTRPEVHHTIGTNYAHGLRLYNNVFLGCGDERLSRGWYSVGLELEDVKAEYNYVGKIDYSPVFEGNAPIGTGEHDNDSFCELHGINGGDPGLANPELQNFRLLRGSRLIDAGTDVVNVLHDIEQQARPQGKSTDIGPWEYASQAVDSEMPNPPGNLWFLEH